MNKLWLRFGLLLHRVVSPLVLGIMFYAVVTPMGWIMRVCGKDNLKDARRRRRRQLLDPPDPPGPKPDSLNNQF